MLKIKLKHLFIFSLFLIVATIYAQSALAIDESDIIIWSDYEGSSTVLVDEKGYQNGSIQGTLTRGTADKPSGLPYSLTGSFSGTNFAQWASDPTTQNLDATTDRTILFWTKSVNSGGLSGDYQVGSGSTGHFGVASGTTYFYLLNGANPLASGGIPIGELSGWNLHAGVINSSTSSIEYWINGELRNTTAYSTVMPISNTVARKIGYSDESAGAGAVNGIAQYIIIEGVLTSSEQTCLYNSGAGRNYSSFVTNCLGSGASNYSISVVNKYNDSALNNVSATLNGSTFYNTTGNVIYTNISNNASFLYDISLTGEYAFSESLTDHNLSANSTLKLDKYTEFSAYEYITDNPIINFTVSMAGYTYTTTNGVAYLPANNSLVSFNSDIHAQTNATVSKQQYYNFTGYTENSVQVYIYDQDTGSIINDTTISILFSGNSSEDNYTTTNGTLYVDGLLDGQYSVKASGSNYTQGTYLITVASDSFQTLNIYLSIETSQVLFTIKDFDDEAVLIDASIVMARFIDGGWSTVNSKLSDITGRVQFEYVENIKYRFTVSKDDYENNIFYLDPILFSNYNVLLTKDTALPSDSDYLSIVIEDSGTEFYANQTNNYTWLINSPDGSLEFYNLSITADSVYGFSGISATGESFSTSFDINTSSTVVISYCYDITLGNIRCFKDTYRVIGSYDDSSFIAQKDNTFGLGLFERVLIASLFALFIAGVLGSVGGALAGAGVGMLVLGFFVLTAFIPLWAVLPSIFVTVIIIAGRSD